MADTQYTYDNQDTSAGGIKGLIRKIQERAPSSTKVVGLVTLLAAGTVLMFLAGLTLTGTVVAMAVAVPLLILFSPILVPVGTVLFLTVGGLLTAASFGLALVTGGSWVYRYVKGRHPVGSDQVDYARMRIADTATHVKDRAREYGGYLHSKVQDAAPGA